MNITVKELLKLDKNSYQLIDMRSDSERAYGTIPDAINLKAEEIAGNDKIYSSKKLVICCSRGQFSIDVAESLCEQGYDAVSLEGGYISWLLERFSNEENKSSAEKAEQSLRKKFRKTIWSRFTKAINVYELIKPNDSVAVCISGGKDSMLMAKCFQELKKYSKFDFDVKYLVMDPGYSPANRQIIEKNAEKLGIPITIRESNIFDSVYNIEKSPCYLCARMRRGYLYNFARELGCNKIALGHHYDDVIETILMGMLYGAQIQTMMPKLYSTNFEGMTKFEKQRNFKTGFYQIRSYFVQLYCCEHGLWNDDGKYRLSLVCLTFYKPYGLYRSVSVCADNVPEQWCINCHNCCYSVSHEQPAGFLQSFIHTDFQKNRT